MQVDPNNPFWPLPPDYGDLTSIGQKQARLAVLKDQSSPEKLVIAWHLFRNLYLKPVGETFYTGGFVESPEFHYELVHDLGQHARNALGAPRGSAKSTVIGKEIPLMLLLTRDYYPIHMCLATDALVETRLDDIILQVTENPLIIEDFGIMKPKRGQAIWNHHHLHFNNGSVLQGISVMGKKRGGRPRLFILDDPESDPDSDSITSQNTILEKFEKILFRQIIPMLEIKNGSAIFWIGTLINRRSFLYHACCTDDPRFALWNRRVLSALTYDIKDPKKVTALWEEKWPEDALAIRKAEIGPSAFAAEYENRPTSDDQRLLVISPTWNEYRVEGITKVPVSPMEETAEVTWYEKNKDLTLAEATVSKEKPFNEWVNSMFRIGVFDYASGLKQYSDYSCLEILGFDTNNCLWVLDMWMGRAKESELLRRIYEFNMKWMTRAIGIESSSVQISFVDSVAEYVEKRHDPNTPGPTVPGWRPRVIPVKYPSNASKDSRIAGLEWRYGPGKIKYPAYMKDQWPFNMLYSQTLDFTRDLALLRFDDAIDTLAMSQYVVHARGMRGRGKKSGDKTLLEQIREGRSVVPGLPLLSGIDPSSLSGEELSALLENHYRKGYNKHQNRYIRRRPNVIGNTRV